MESALNKIKKMKRNHLYLIIGIIILLIVGGFIGLSFGLMKSSSSGENTTKSTSFTTTNTYITFTTEGSTSSQFDNYSNKINLISDKNKLVTRRSNRSLKEATKSTTETDRETTTKIPKPDHDPANDDYLLENSAKLNSWINNPNLKHQTDFYFFNVTNPKQIEKGEKPILVQVGPFIFDEKRIYFNKSFDSDKEHLNLKFKKNYFYSGIGNLNDNVTVLNVPLVSVYNIIDNFHIGPILKYPIYHAILKRHPLFITKRIGDLLFDGYKDNVVDEIRKSISLINHLYDFKIPASIDKNGRFSFMASRNDSDYGLWTVNTGFDDENQLGQLFKLNGKSNIECWKEKSTCSKIKGSDGIVHPPFAGESHKLKIFVPELNRSIILDYDKDTSYNKISTRRFIWSANTFKSSIAYPPNECFYTNSKDELNKYSGVLFNSHCNYNIPIVFSNPHFYQADRYYTDSVKGLKPIRHKHESSIEVRKNNGELILGNKNLQINIDTSIISSKRGIDRFIFPLFWLAESTKFVS